MSVSEILKTDILDSKIDKKCCKRAFLSGVIRASGSLNIERKGLGLIIQNSSEYLIEKCAEIIRILTQYTPSIFRKERSRSIGKKLVYELYLSGSQSKKLLMETGITSAPSIINDAIPPALIANDCCKRAYIKGLYSATGNLSVAENGKKGATGYYLEFSLASQNIANETVEILKSGGVEAKTREKKGAYYIYIKDSEKISDFCAFIGANKGYFALQEVILSRLVSNTANRQFNCEIANIDRTISAATKQTEAILYIKEHAGLESLPETLRITAEARLNHPSASVKELGTLLDTPASKSGISHRMRKIIEIATKLKENNPMLKEKIITAPRGIRAEDCAVIAQAASRYISDIFVIAAQKKVNAKSIMGLISLNMKKDDVVYLSVSGDDEKAAFEHINSLF